MQNTSFSVFVENLCRSIFYLLLAVMNSLIMIVRFKIRKSIISTIKILSKINIFYLVFFSHRERWSWPGQQGCNRPDFLKIWDMSQIHAQDFSGLTQIGISLYVLYRQYRVFKKEGQNVNCYKILKISLFIQVLDLEHR